MSGNIPTTPTAGDRRNKDFALGVTGDTPPRKRDIALQESILRGIRVRPVKIENIKTEPSTKMVNGCYHCQKL